MRAASVAGPSHRVNGRPVQDAYGWVQAGAFLVVAVADGVGAAAQAGLGAELAVRAALDGAQRNLQDALGAAEAALREAASALGDVPGATAEDLATTLVVAVTDGEGAWLARVGDSSAWVLDVRGLTEVFPLPPEESEVADTATAALPGGWSKAETAVLALDQGQVLLLVTDGIARPLRDGPTTVVPAFVDVLREPPEPLALAALADFSRQGCTDDRTLLGVWIHSNQSNH